MMKASLFLAAVIFLVGCVHSSIVPFAPSAGLAPKVEPPTNPHDVGVYRSTRPFASFKELGIITFRSYDEDLNEMYNQIRKDAAAYGAQAVIDTRVTEETHPEWVTGNRCVPETVCNTQGMCSTQDRCYPEQTIQYVTTYLITGSMVKGAP